MASHQDGPIYSASKHGVLGLMRALHPSCKHEGIRVSIIHPWFASTAILAPHIMSELKGVPLSVSQIKLSRSLFMMLFYLAPVERIAGCIFLSATDPDMRTSGCPWLLPDDGLVLRLEREQLKEGVYQIMDQRAAKL